MGVGYHAGGEQENPFTDLDEFLCEYVDGTMDPAVRKAFEEYVSSDPALAAHVHQLLETRQLLCRYGHQVHAPCWLQSRLRQQLVAEMSRSTSPVLPFFAERLSRAVVASSMIALIIFSGIVASSRVPDAPDAYTASASLGNRPQKMEAGFWADRQHPPAHAVERFSKDLAVYGRYMVVSHRTDSSVARISNHATSLRRISAFRVAK